MFSTNNVNYTLLSYSKIHKGVIIKKMTYSESGFFLSNEWTVLSVNKTQGFSTNKANR